MNLDMSFPQPVQALYENDIPQIVLVVLLLYMPSKDCLDHYGLFVHHFQSFPNKRASKYGLYFDNCFQPMNFDNCLLPTEYALYKDYNFQG
mmetsp:Transcript_23166/g.34200  ORF Transcript_23166/g.34200 Transcript_23166/m.34200 type:complete len:91 (+) Transcript_23166:330-602(+)